MEVFTLKRTHWMEGSLHSRRFQMLGKIVAQRKLDLSRRDQGWRGGRGSLCDEISTVASAVNREKQRLCKWLFASDQIIAFSDIWTIFFRPYLLNQKTNSPVSQISHTLPLSLMTELTHNIKIGNCKEMTSGLYALWLEVYEATCPNFPYYIYENKKHTRMVKNTRNFNPSQWLNQILGRIFIHYKVDTLD